MATTTTTLVPAPRLFPYVSAPDVVQERSGWPRGEVSFHLDSATVIVAGAGEDQSVVVNCVLPGGYAYAMREAHWSMTVVDADEWESVAFCQFVNGVPAADRSIIVPMEGISAGALRADTRRVWTIQNIMKQVSLPAGPKENQEFKIILTDPVIDGPTGTFFLFASFLQFDIEQAHVFAVNYPVPTR